MSDYKKRAPWDKGQLVGTGEDSSQFRVWTIFCIKLSVRMFLDDMTLRQKTQERVLGRSARAFCEMACAHTQKNINDSFHHRNRIVQSLNNNFLVNCTPNATTPNSTKYGVIHWHPHSVPMAKLAYHHFPLTKSASPEHEQIPRTTKFPKSLNGKNKRKNEGIHVPHCTNMSIHRHSTNDTNGAP